jgi:hypothetical protein
MNPTKQFWALIKFQLALYSLPFFILVPLALMFAFHTNTFVSYIVHGYHPPLDQVLSNQNIFFVAFIGVLLLAPEISRSPAISAQWPSGTEFLLTRAVDRRLVIRARAVLYYAVLMVTPLVALPSAIMSPSLQIHGNSSAQQQQILTGVQGSIPVQAAQGDSSAHDVIIHDGSLLVESWRYWILLSLALATELLVMLVYPLKYRRYLIWVAYGVLVILPLALLPHTFGLINGVGYRERLFFVFVSYQPAVWLCTIAALVLGQLWCERRFARTEH